MKRAFRLAFGAVTLLGAATAGPGAARATGDLSRQQPVEVVVELGRPDGRHAFEPSRLRFETGRLYRLVLRNVSRETLAEFKGAIREVEVHPGHSAEWWFVPVAAGRIADLRCGIVAADGRTHAEHGMVGEIVIE